MAPIKSSDLKKSIIKILKGADLTTLSSKMIRRRCEEHFGVNLLSRKQEVDDIIMTYVSNEEQKKDGSDDDATSNNDEASDSEPLEQSVSENKSSDSDNDNRQTPQKMKKKNVENSSPNEKHGTQKKSTSKKVTKPVSKDNSLQEEKEDNNRSDDEALARQLQDEEWNLRSRSSKRSSVKRTVVKRKTKKDEDGKVKVRKGTSTYSRKCQLSAELAEIMESNEMARPDVVKKMWSIVRERDLFDPSNKQFAFCDEQLRKVFGTKRIRMFSMMKYLKSHIKDLRG